MESVERNVMESLGANGLADEKGGAGAGPHRDASGKDGKKS